MDGANEDDSESEEDKSENEMKMEMEINNKVCNMGMFNMFGNKPNDMNNKKTSKLLRKRQRRRAKLEDNSALDAD